MFLLSSHIRLAARIVVTSLLIVSGAVYSKGISVQSTRVIYPLDSHQQSTSVRNTSPTDTYMVQSWVENADGNKSHDFVVTPPLYVSAPGNENTLRIMRVGGTPPQDRESLYYFVVKAIPSIDDSKNDSNKSVIRIAAATRMKLLVRPANLTPGLEKAPAELSFHRSGNQMEVVNPTPYYLTLTGIKVAGKNVEGILAPPKSSIRVNLPTGASNSIIFSTINDYGAITPAITAPLTHSAE